MFLRGGDLKLSLFADADYADRCKDRRSVSDVAVMLENSSMNGSTTQHFATLHTSEAEYLAKAHGAKTALPIKAVWDFVQPHLRGRAIGMYEDNKGQRPWLQIPRVLKAANTDVRFHFLRRLVRLRQVTSHSEDSAEQHADILTKPLGRKALRRHRDF